MKLAFLKIIFICSHTKFAYFNTGRMLSRMFAIPTKGPPVDDRNLAIDK